MIEQRRNWAVWLGFLLALGAMLCNVVLFVNFPGQRAIPWLSLLLAVFALILFHEDSETRGGLLPRLQRL